MKIKRIGSWRRLVGGVVLAGTLACLTACDDSDASNVQITVREDLSGTIRSTRLVIPDNAATAQFGSSGVSWHAAAQVTTTKGDFTSLSGVKLEDITFSCDTTPKGLHVLRVTLPRGPEAKWPKALTNPSADRRRETTAAIFPEQKDSRLGSVIAIAITLPATPISHGVSPVASGISASVEKTVVTLTVRADTAVKSGSEIVWDMTWGGVK